LKPQDAGEAISDKLLQIMATLNVPNGLSSVGITENDIPQLVRATLPQHRVTKISPRQPIGEPELAYLFEQAMNE